MDNNDTVNALREALLITPDNAPLREHLGDLLMSMGRFEEAEKEYSTALIKAPDNDKLKVSLANAFYKLSKYTQALVIVEDLVKTLKPPAASHLLYARLLLNDGNSARAAEQYGKAIKLDANLADQSLAERLTLRVEVPVGAQADSADEDLGEEVELPGCTSPERPSVTFDKVGGMEAVKEQIRMKIIYPLTNASMFAAYGKKAGGGVLMYGPPGCGKTHLARATAGEIKSVFIAVGIAEILDMWVGRSERNLHELFEQARRLKPCVLFFDEVDALAASRADMRGSSRQIINQFLLELDGMDGNNDDILVLGATNAPWHLDSAFRRPGRFDRIVFVAPPDALARAEIFRLMLKDKPIDSKIDFAHLAKKSEKYSGADIKNIIDITIEKKLEQAMKTGQPKPITMRDLEDAIKVVKPTTVEWFATAKNYAMYSNQGGVYDDVLNYLKIS
jgi:transitional endoplasmic reticulum ATPase